ncbi:MAG TPA: HAMP domain-containing sensor histidine kinase [Solirubrobacteraceae bacterium]
MLDRLPIRWRLALTSAALTFAILCTFAIAVGELTQRRIREDFREQTAEAADRLSHNFVVEYDPSTGTVRIDKRQLELVAGSESAALRILDQAGGVIRQTPGAPAFSGVPRVGSAIEHGYRIETRLIPLQFGAGYLQFARPLSDLEATLRRVRFFLLFGVLGGTALSLLGGLMVARRAMAPIALLTATAEEIRRTRDPDRRIDVPTTEDEVAQLALTLDEMLQALAAARDETEAALDRQREFVADASHELRTPLTSVIANLELLADTLDGEQGEGARAALRSSQRMRRLVADLLLLARADAGRHAPQAPVDLEAVLGEAAAEVGTLARDHELSLETHRVWVEGVRDDLHRLARNLLENALRHTPPGTHVRARVDRRDGQAELVVEDDGPGIPRELRDRVFERFVRGAGDHGASFGLGLSIVRAVADEHAGSVVVEDARPGARFVVRLPVSAAQSLDLDDDRQHHRATA